MLKGIIKTILLVLAIVFLATSIKELSSICAAVGGTCAWIYANIKD